MKKRFPKTIDNTLNLDHLVQLLYDKMFTKYYNDRQLIDWHSLQYFGGGNAQKYKSQINKLLNEGFKVKTGYKTSKMIRGSKTHYIFYKDPK